MEPITSPELEQCIRDKEDLEKKKKATQDEFSNDMQDASVVQGDSQNQQSEVKTTLQDYATTKKEWDDLKVKLDSLTTEYNSLNSLAQALNVKYMGCQSAVAKKAEADAAKK